MKREAFSPVFLAQLKALAVKLREVTTPPLLCPKCGGELDVIFGRSSGTWRALHPGNECVWRSAIWRGSQDEAEFRASFATIEPSLPSDEFTSVVTETIEARNEQLAADRRRKETRARRLEALRRAGRIS